MEIIVRCVKLFSHDTPGELPAGSYVDFDVTQHEKFEPFIVKSKADWPTYAQTVVDGWNRELPDFYSYTIVAVNP